LSLFVIRTYNFLDIAKWLSNFFSDGPSILRVILQAPSPFFVDPTSVVMLQTLLPEILSRHLIRHRSLPVAELQKVGIDTWGKMLRQHVAQALMFR
jgi:hypothetical protein